jgi:hypothetical protein
VEFVAGAGGATKGTGTPTGAVFCATAAATEDVGGAGRGSGGCDTDAGTAAAAAAGAIGTAATFTSVTTGAEVDRGGGELAAVVVLGGGGWWSPTVLGASSPLLGSDVDTSGSPWSSLPTLLCIPARQAFRSPMLN